MFSIIYNKIFVADMRGIQENFDRVGVPYQRVEGDTGIMGGSLSHEYHYPAGIRYGFPCPANIS